MKKSDPFQQNRTTVAKAGFGFCAKSMRGLATPVLAASLLAGIASVPAHAEQNLLSKIVFGTFYNDNVTVIDASHPGGHGSRDLPLNVIYPSSEMVKTSQAEVKNSPALRAALQKRNIRTFNVLWVQTAMNGGKVVYIK